MAVAVTNAELARLLESLTYGLTLRLYANDREPDPGGDDEAADFAEADFDGYEPAALASWSVEEGSPPVAAHPRVAFRCAENGLPVDVYGYYLTRSDGSLAWAEAFDDGPYTVQTKGDEVGVTPRIAGREGG